MDSKWLLKPVSREDSYLASKSYSFLKLTLKVSRSIALCTTLLVLTAGVFSAVQAQTTVTGTVIDAADGSVLPGVNVIVQGSQEQTGSTIGTTTSMDGTFSINVPEGLNILEFSFIGYQRTTIEIDGRTEIEVELQQDLQLLDDVVVVGYGTQERRQITGSVSSIDSDDFNAGDVNNPSELIQGKVPGLNISNPGSNPNEAPTIRLRGISSFSNTQPLVVVDGIVGASLENIDPNDIESIDVLKDASAAAIYGTRGGAGVIAITTKKGEAGATTVSYTGNFTTNGVENKVDVLTGDEFRQLGENTSFEIDDFGTNTDWFDEITQNSYTHTHNLSISGGSETTTYRVSGNFRDNEGLLRTTGFSQTSGRLNLNHRAFDNQLTLTFDLGITNREESRGFNNAFQYAVTFNPTAPARDDGFDNTGGYTEIDAFDVFNPVAIVETAEDLRESNRINAALKADYNFDQIVSGLTGSAFYSLQTFDGSRNAFFSRRNKNVGGASTSSLGRGRAERSSDESRSEQFDLTFDYSNTISEGLGLQALAGYSFQESVSEGTFVGGGDYISDAVGASNLDFVQDFDNGLGDISSYKNENTLIAAFGRVNFNVDDTYFLNATLRREGSSRFGENNQWGDFWSVGASVELLNLIDIDVLDRLRLRGSYGITGQDAPFDGISRLRFGPTGNFFTGGSFIQRFGPVSNDNPDLKWQETGEYNVGLDFSVNDERLVGTVEYYQKNTSDLIMEMEVPVPPNLFPTSWLNVGEIESKGLEATLEYDVIRNPNIRWNTGFTLSTYDINLVEFESDNPRFLANVGSPGQNNTQQVRVRAGEPLGQIWGPRFAEIGDDGRWLFYDADDNLITSGEVSRDDEAVIGNGIPDFELGWTNSVNYKNWDARIFLRGVYGHDLVNSSRVFFENPANITTYNVTKSALDLTDLTSTPAYSSFHVEDASFLRMENFSIGYNFPLSNESSFSRIRLSLSGRNLFTITGYDGIDPEVRWVDTGDGNNPLSPGIERRDSWYTARSFTLGVNIDF
ncbi:MAG: SusC/RagA family TonB-linked outer membrane protein [Balneolaceae bacterium]